MPLTIKNIIIGEGIPKICVPIVGKSIDECINQAKEIKTSRYYSRIDLVEFRGDCLECSDNNKETNIDIILKALINVKEILGEKILLFTYRSAFEGGTKEKETEMSKHDIIDLDIKVIESNNIDLIDIELFMGEKFVEEVVAFAHDNNVKVIMSNHDFNETPNGDEIIKRLIKMDELEADIVKLAAMPQVVNDVTTILSATALAKDAIAKPVVTMSMGRIGSISRFAGQYFGSDITFGSIKKTSAPGQINIEQLVQLLDSINMLL